MGRRSPENTSRTRPCLVILVDTSAWVEFLRKTGHPVDKKLTGLIGKDADLAVTEIVIMELLAGARDMHHLQSLRSKLLSYPVLILQGLADYEEAAMIYRACRQEGETIKAIADCLIAVPALREGARVLHNDSDFDVISRHAGLKIEPITSR